MALLKNGVAYTLAYVPTGNQNEYSFVGGIYNDPSGVTFCTDVAIGWVIYIPAMDSNTGFPVIGKYLRYRLTSVSNQDINTGLFDATILYDGFESMEPAIPTNDTASLISETTTNNLLGNISPLPDAQSNSVYVSAGAAAGALSTDMKDKIDFISGAGSGAVLIDGSIATRMINAVGSVGIGLGVISFGNDGFILADNTIPGKEETLGITLDITGSGQYCRILLNGAAKDVFAPGQFPDNDILCQGSAGILVAWDDVPNTLGQDEVISIGQTFGSGRHFVFRKQYYTNI